MMIDLNSSAISEEKPKQRKSMPCGRRRSKSFGASAAEIHRLIPMDLPKEERLKQLFKMSFQRTLLTVCGEFSSEPDFDKESVIDNVSEDYGRIEAMLEKDNMIKLCVADPVASSQTEDIVINKYIEGIEVLQTESNEWDSIVKEEEENLKKCMNSVTNTLAEEVSIRNIGEALSFDYNKLLKKTNAMLGDYSVLTEHLSDHAAGPRAILKNNAKHFDCLSTIASKKLKTDLDETPRAVLRKVHTAL